MLQKKELKYSFEDGVVLKAGTYYTFRLEQIPIDHLVVTSGKIVACDPHTYDHLNKPFVREIPVGIYPIYLTRAHVVEENNKRVAFARLQIQAGKQPVTWENALLPDQDVSTLDEGTYFEYGVDAGTGCFMDVDATSKWTTLLGQARKVAITNKPL